VPRYSPALASAFRYVRRLHNWPKSLGVTAAALAVIGGRQRGRGVIGEGVAAQGQERELMDAGGHTFLEELP
jgi:hypothetical protein